MTLFKTLKTQPGIASLAPVIQEVETALPVFIGFTEKSPEQLKLVKIKSILEYQVQFGGPQPEKNLQIRLKEVADENGNQISMDVESVFNGNHSPHNIFYALQAFFRNGGASCFVLSIGSFLAPDEPMPAEPFYKGLSFLARQNDPSMIVIPEAVNLPLPETYYHLLNEVLKVCSQTRDKFLIADAYHRLNPSLMLDSFRKSTVHNPHLLRYGAIYYPWLHLDMGYIYREEEVKIQHRTLFSRGIWQAGKYHRKSLKELKEMDEDLYRKAIETIRKKPVVLPPAAAMAGIYARVDQSRGVWKAPAGIALEGVKELDYHINRSLQEQMQIDQDFGKSINPIMEFPGQEFRIWGTRTFAGNDNEWKYISVIRCYMMIEESVKHAVDQLEITENNENSWTGIRQMVTDYLTIKWREGALQGALPKEAFFVKVGLGETMTHDDIQNGRLVVMFGISMIKPAEFLISRLLFRVNQA
jgi:phage tail sheath protein FI